jgi:hypothetical protein
MVVRLKDIEKLREDRHIPCTVFVFEQGCNGIKSKETVEIISGTHVQRLSFFESIDFRNEPPERR